MPRRNPTFFPQRVNCRVPLMTYVAGIEGDDFITVEYGAPLAQDPIATAGSLLTGQSIATAGGTSVFNPAYTASEAQMARWGRCINAVGSAATTAVLSIFGRDYLGSRMIENITLNGTTVVLGQKAFRFVDRIEWTATPAVTINVGFSNGLGLPFKIKHMVSEIKNNAVSAAAGAIVVGLANNIAATATNADVRGRYTPVGVLPNGVNTFEVRFIADTTNLHGNAQFAG